MSADRGRRRRQTGQGIREAAGRRFSTELRPYRESQRVRDELIAFKAREREKRRIQQDRERLAREALELAQVELDSLENRELDNLPEPGTRAYKNMLKREEKSIGHMETLRRSRSGIGLVDLTRRRNRFLGYKENIAHMIENVANRKLRDFISARHIEALQQDGTRFSEFRIKAYNVIIAALEDADADLLDQMDCIFCDMVFLSNRLRIEHNRAVHYPYFAKKAWGTLFNH